MSKTKCAFCDEDASIRSEHFHTGRNDLSGKEIIVEDVQMFECASCETTWLSNQEEERVNREVTNRTRYYLDSKAVKAVREALGFRTKTAASDFLGLNSKAFTKWEKRYTEPNAAYDLLLRLSVFSEQNFEFIKALHAKDFAFDSNDYELMCRNSKSEWNYDKSLLEQIEVSLGQGIDLATSEILNSPDIFGASQTWNLGTMTTTVRRDSQNYDPADAA